MKYLQTAMILSIIFFVTSTSLRSSNEPNIVSLRKENFEKIISYKKSEDPVIVALINGQFCKNQLKTKFRRNTKP